MITPAYFLPRITTALIVSMMALSSIAAAQQVWEELRGPEGGDVTVLARSRNAVIAGTNGTGLFRSTDQGRTWTRVVDAYNMTGARYNSLAVQGDTVYAGADRGLFRSLDNGLTWSEIRSSAFTTPSMQVAAHNGIVAASSLGWDGKLYLITPAGTVGSISHTGAIGQHRGLGVSNRALFIINRDTCFRSTDMGATWHTIPIYTYSAAFIVSGDTVIVNTYNGYIYRSTDNGDHWGPGRYIGVANVAMLGATMYGTRWLYDEVHLLRSTDAGATWNNTTKTPRLQSLLLLPGTMIGASGERRGIYRSLDSGATWFESNNGLVKQPASALLRYGSELLLGTPIGLYSLRAGEDSLEWMSRDLNTITVRYLARIGDDIVVCSDNHFYRWSSRTRKWTTEEIEPRAGEVTAFAGNGKMLYVAARGTIYRIINSSVGLRYTRTYIDSAAIRSIAAVENVVLATDGTRVWRTIDSGRTWEEPYGQDDPLFEEGNAILQITSIDTTFYAVTRKGIFTSNNASLPWKRLSSGLDGRSISSIACGEDALYVGTDSGIYRSLDEGATWSAFNDGLADHTILKLERFGKMLYASTASGFIYRIQVSTLSAPDESAASNADANRLALRPNPAATRATIGYTLTRRGPASIKLFDAMGREVRTLLDEDSEAGVRELQLDLTGLPGGAYFLRLEADGTLTTRAVMIER